MLDQHDKNQNFANNCVKSTQSGKPLIFTKKIKDNYKVIPHNFTLNTLGKTRHFPAATKEWFNSIYAYNNSNTIKNLPVLDKTLSRLIQSYFNLFLNESSISSTKPKVSNLKSSKPLPSKRIPTRYKRASFNKIFVGKAELKHTSSKVIITLYIYNEEKRILDSKLKSILTRIFPSLKILNTISKSEKNISEIWDKPLTFRERFTKILKLSSIILSILCKKSAKKNQKLNIMESPLYLFKPGLINTANRINLTKELAQTKAFDDYADIIKPDLFKAGIFNAATIIYLNKEFEEFAETKMKLAINKAKFENSFLSKLTPLVSKLYNKEVEFNIVNLKAIYLSTDIFTEIIATKLKNRDNKLLHVLKSALALIRLPPVNKMKERYAKDDSGRIWINSAKNLALNSYNSDHTNKDYLSQLLMGILSGESRTTGEALATQGKAIRGDLSNNIQDLVFKDIKHKMMGGARLEAKGRLTKRFTASRSVFKVKWAGSLKEIDSSFRGLSTVNLRGHAKSNIQYSVINSKTRNGTFGLKGWIAGK